MAAVRGKRAWGRAVGFGAAVAAFGCAHHPMAQRYAGPASPGAQWVETFRTPERVKLLSDEPREVHWGYRQRRVTLASAVNRLESGSIVVDLFVPDGAQRRAAVLVLPILGGKNRIANHFARVFASQGFVAAIVHRKDGYKKTDDLKQLNLVFEQIVLDHKQVITWLESRPEVDPRRIGLFGVSAGAVKGVLVCAADPRVRAAVLGLAGGDVPRLFAYSTERGLVKKREKIMAQHKVTAEELEKALREGFDYDPIDHAPKVDARRVLLILGRHDTVVPYETGVRLREAMGGPETIVLPSGHYDAIVWLPYLQHAAVSHLRRHLGVE